jgi:uncharacterized protein YajQ (UPF0234 family)
LHFATEYSQIINDYGPAIKQWSMRYEAYHSYFKRIALKSNNFKNVSKMLATRYQLKNIYQLSSMRQMEDFDQSMHIQKVENNYFNDAMKQVLLNHFGNIDISQDLLQCNKFYHEKREYRRSNVYIIDLIDTNETPKFIQILYILKKSNKWWLMVDELETMGYNEKLCAWQISSIDHFSMIDPHNMKYFSKGLDIYELNNSSFVCFTARFTLYQSV